jgi:TolC family type I secretion outer membrane protein
LQNLLVFLSKYLSRQPAAIIHYYMIRCWLLLFIWFFSFAAFAQETLPPPAVISNIPPNLPKLLPTGESESSVAPFVAVESNQKTEAKQPNEPVIDGKPNVQTFEQALISAYLHHPSLKAEREALAALDESVAQAISGFRPNVEAGYSRGRQKREVGDSGDSFQDTSSKSITAEQSVFSGGESWANFKGSRERVRAGRARLHAAEQQVLYDAVIAYTAMYERHNILKLSQNNVDVLRQQFEATQARFKVGELTQTDVAQSQARLLKAQADERQALGDLEVARATYRRVIASEPPAELVLPPLPAMIPESLEVVRQKAGETNPSLLAATFEEKAASYDIDSRAGAILPEVSVRGSMSRVENGNTQQIGKVDTDALTLNVSIPLYQSGAEWSRLREARNLADKAKFDALDTRNAVIENATSAWQDFSTAQAIILSTKEALSAAELALDGVRQENQYGTRTILDVLDAEQEAFQARVDVVIAERNERIQAYRLLAATGDLTARSLALPVSYYDPKEHYDSVKYQLLGL